MMCLYIHIDIRLSWFLLQHCSDLRSQSLSFFFKLGVVPGNGRDLGQPAIPGLGTMPETTRVWAKIGVGNEWLVLDRPKSAMRSENLTQILWNLKHSIQFQWSIHSVTIQTNGQELQELTRCVKLARLASGMSYGRVSSSCWIMFFFFKYRFRDLPDVMQNSSGFLWEFRGNTQIPWMITIVSPLKSTYLVAPHHFQTHPSRCFSTRRCQLLKDVAATPHQCIPFAAFRRIHFPGHSRRCWLSPWAFFERWLWII